MLVQLIDYLSGTWFYGFLLTLLLLGSITAIRVLIFLFYYKTKQPCGLSHVLLKVLALVYLSAVWPQTIYVLIEELGRNLFFERSNKGFKPSI